MFTSKLLLLKALADGGKLEARGKIIEKFSDFLRFLLDLGNFRKIENIEIGKRKRVWKTRKMENVKFQV